MKRLLLLLFLFTSCIKEQEIKPIDQWWLKNKCVEQYTVTSYQTIYRFCWIAELECNGIKKEVSKCFYTNCEIAGVIQQENPNCKILNLYKVK